MTTKSFIQFITDINGKKKTNNNITFLERYYFIYVNIVLAVIVIEID